VHPSVDGDPDASRPAEDLVFGGDRGRVELAKGAVSVSRGEYGSVPDSVCARQRCLLASNEVGLSGRRHASRGVRARSTFASYALTARSPIPIIARR
jgi:hypothetical protein